MLQPSIVGFRRKLRRFSKPIAVLFLIFLVLSVYVAYHISISQENQNQLTFTSPAYNLTVTPVTISIPPGYHGISEIQVYGQINLTSLSGMTVTAYSGSTQYLPYYSVTYNDGYARIYVDLNGTVTSAGNLQVNLLFNHTGRITFPVGVQYTILPELFEILGGVSAFLFVLGLFSWNLDYRRIAVYMIPVYIVLAAFFGQRYDSFFMITTGIRLMDGVNPFVGSAMLPPSLKWEYLPLFLPYSMFVYYFGRFLGIPAISNASLNFAGTSSGFTFMAWRAFVPSFLAPYYAVIKLPMIAATIGVWLILSRNQPGVRGKLSALWLFNPYVIMVGVMWGQLDVLATFFLLYSLVELRKGNTLIASLMCSLGAGIKIFPIFLLPAILRESKNVVRDVAVFVAGMLPNIIIYMIAGSPVNALSELLFSRSIPTFNGIFSSNGISWQFILQDLGVTSFPSLFLYAFVPFYVVFTILYLFKNRNRSYTTYLIVVLLAFFLTYNYVNPQYFIWILPLFLLLERFREAIVFSVIPLIYMYISYNLSYFINPYYSYNYLSSALGQIELIRLGILSSLLLPFVILANVIFVLLMYRIFRGVIRSYWKDNTDRETSSID